MRRAAALVMIAVLGSLVAVVPSAAGGGCHGTDDPTSGASDDGGLVAIERCMFGPTVVYVEPGAKLTWVNRDEAPHTVTGVAQSWGSHDNLSRGQEVSHVFKSEGVYPYYCLLHPSMVGAVVVGDPAVSKSGAAPLPKDVEPVSKAAPEGVAQTDAEPAAAAASTGVPLIAVTVVTAALLLGAAYALGFARKGRLEQH